MPSYMYFISEKRIDVLLQIKSFESNQVELNFQSKGGGADTAQKM